MALFAQFQNIQVIGHAGRNDGVTGQVEALEPDVTLLDCYLIHIPGYVLSADIIEQGSATHVMALAPAVDPVHMKRMLAAGVTGYVIKQILLKM
jgi:response regulator of citrate/malate metabolism